ncbi:MAG TPA: Hsp20/alpha crystallin family protein [Thermohalobaculum sp.]|nr:Hsp20/alpha crystallin family protein [Thermohalobaculum sp.]
MQVKDLIPWARGGKAPDAKDGGTNPLVQLQDEMNRVFESFWSRFDRQAPSVGSTPYPMAGSGGIGFPGVGFPWNGTTPRADVVETGDGVEVTIELPGLEQKDVEVTLTDDLLTVKGEKKVAREDSRKGWYLAERAYGAFHRAIPLPPGVDSEKAEAVFRNGVLTVKLPQSAEARAKVRRIDVKAA